MSLTGLPISMVRDACFQLLAVTGPDTWNHGINEFEGTHMDHQVIATDRDSWETEENLEKKLLN